MIDMHADIPNVDAQSFAKMLASKPGNFRDLFLQSFQSIVRHRSIRTLTMDLSVSIIDDEHELSKEPSVNANNFFNPN